MVLVYNSIMNSPFAAPAPTPTEVLKWETKISVSILVGVSLLGVGLLLLDRIYKTRILPNTTIDGIVVSGKTKEEALDLLLQQSYEIPIATITAKVDDIQVSSSAAELGIHRNLDYIVDVAYQHGKKGTIISRLKSLLASFKNTTKLASSNTLDEDKVDSFVQLVATKVNIPGIEPSISLKTTGKEDSLEVYPGFVGREVVQKDTILRTIDVVEKGSFEIDVPIASVSTKLNDQQIEEFTHYAEAFVGLSIPYQFDKDVQLKLSDVDLVSFLSYPNTLFLHKIKETLSEWEKQVTRQPEDAQFEFDKKTLKVETFVPHRDGRVLQKDQLFSQITTLLEEIPQKKAADESYTIEPQVLPVATVSPKIKLGDTNTLGITERIGFGESYYHHSIPTRVHNVGITSERINVAIVPPGKEFSFNATLGEVSSRTGYKPAYVISNGKTQLGDGGGVCQVSSTLFRAVLDAGLDITRRLQHSYRVSYYELNSDPGFDATVYSGNVDFRFINDTNEHVLMYLQNDPENLHLTVELYGTSDGRTTKISNYRKWDPKPALPTEFIPDPSLPAGVKKQIDWSVSGIKTEFDHTVTTKNGEILHQDTYYSNYRPWSAKYLVGTGGQ